MGLNMAKNKTLYILLVALLGLLVLSVAAIIATPLWTPQGGWCGGQWNVFQPGRGWGMGHHGGWGQGGWNSYITVDRDNVVKYAEDYAKSYSSNLEVKVVEEYTNNFYVIVWDTQRDIGAFELVISRNGGVHFEPHSMMWNTLYGPHSIGKTEWPISIEEAKKIAQNWIDANFPGGVVVEEYVFPGYYTFHFKINGEMQMLSVNAYNGQVWFHSWHGGYIGEVLEDEH